MGLRGLEAFLDRPAGAGQPDQLLVGGGAWPVAQVVGDLVRGRRGCGGSAVTGPCLRWLILCRVVRLRPSRTAAAPWRHRRSSSVSTPARARELRGCRRGCCGELPVLVDVGPPGRGVHHVATAVHAWGGSGGGVGAPGAKGYVNAAAPVRTQMEGQERKGHCPVHGRVGPTAPRPRPLRTVGVDQRPVVHTCTTGQAMFIRSHNARSSTPPARRCARSSRPRTVSLISGDE